VSGMPDEGLKQALGLGYATLFGVGLILGAGIYVLIGRAAGFAGDAVWLSVLFAAVIALTTGLSYAELSSMYPRAASTHLYVREAFPRSGVVAYVAAWLIFYEGVAGAATAALGFARYFTQLIGMQETYAVAIALLLLAALTVINWVGIEESAVLTVVFTFIEAFGLVLVAALGFAAPLREPDYLAVNPGVNPFTGVLLGAAVFYFAFTGFELQPTLSEETREAERVMPRAIMLALSITSGLYMLVALSVVRLLPWWALAESGAPLADAASAAMPYAYTLLMGIALFSTSNTVLGFLVSSSRILYGLAEENAVPRVFAAVDERRRTPAIAVLFSGVLSILTILLCAYLPQLTGLELKIDGIEYKLIDVVGKASSLACIIAFILVNASVVALRFSKPDNPRYFKIPLNLGRLPLMPLASILLTITFIVVSFADPIVWLSTAIITALGLIMFRGAWGQRSP